MRYYFLLIVFYLLIVCSTSLEINHKAFDVRFIFFLIFPVALMPCSHLDREEGTGWWWCCCQDWACCLSVVENVRTTLRREGWDLQPHYSTEHRCPQGTSSSPPSLYRSLTLCIVVFQDGCLQRRMVINQGIETRTYLLTCDWCSALMIHPQRLNIQ